VRIIFYFRSYNYLRVLCFGTRHKVISIGIFRRCGGTTAIVFRVEEKEKEREFVVCRGFFFFASITLVSMKMRALRSAEIKMGPVIDVRSF
jgi:hypothetical protein